uniref:Peptidase S41 n=1 Tax=Angiostrongylus cantonensis TaxID=6313 RepID=A0A0K0D4B5_ANGCA
MRLIFATFMVLLFVQKHEAQTYENQGNHANNASTMSPDEEHFVELYKRAYEEFLDHLDGNRNLGEAGKIASLIAETNNGTDPRPWDISSLGIFGALFATPNVIVENGSPNNDSTSTEPNNIELDLAD